MSRRREARDFVVRHGAAIAHVSKASQAAQLMVELGGTYAMSDTIGAFENVLRAAGSELGLQGKASSEDVRRGLVRRGQDDLAKRWCAARATRRAQAHPDPTVFEEVVVALAQRPAETEGACGKESELGVERAASVSSSSLSEAISIVSRSCLFSGARLRLPALGRYHRRKHRW